MWKDKQGAFLVIFNIDQWDACGLRNEHADTTIPKYDSFKLYFICTIHKYFQSNTVIKYMSILQTGLRRKSKDLFKSVSLNMIGSNCQQLQVDLRLCYKL